MTITFKPVDHPDPKIIDDVLAIEEAAFGDGALSDYVIIPLLHHGKVYTAVDEEENMIACAYFMRDMTDIGLSFLMGVAVLPEFRGHDVGTALLSYAFSHLKRFGITRAQLSVDPANFDALAAYREKLGFAVVESEQDVDGSGEDRLVMEKEL
jgi:ribosomal-protein-alanine N-acetyltransferase